MASLHYHIDQNNNIEAAHLSFLLAYYLFVPLTPPASCSLALHYIKKAISLHNTPTYEQWLDIIKRKLILPKIMAKGGPLIRGPPFIYSF